MDYGSFGIGLAIGLAFTLVVLIYLSWKRASDRKTYFEANQKLRDMVSNKMEIDSEGLSKLKSEVETLRKENENMRISLGVAMQTPGNKELMKAEVLQKAIDKLMLSAPGFGSAWTVAYQEAEEECKEYLSGKVPFFKRVFGIGYTSSKTKVQLPSNDGE